MFCVWLLRVSSLGKSTEIFSFALFGFKNGCLIGHHWLDSRSGGHYAGGLEHHTKKKIGKDSF